MDGVVRGSKFIYMLCGPFTDADILLSDRITIPSEVNGAQDALR